MTRYFLDTTAQIERHAGDETARREIDTRLVGGQHASSTQVFREWKRIVEGSAVDVVNAIAKSSRDLPDTLKHLSLGWGREPGQRLRVLAMLAGQRMDVDLLEIRAQTFLRGEAEELFRHQVDEIRDGSECMLARSEATLNRSGWSLATSCSRRECACVLPGFLEANSQSVEAMAQDLIEYGDRTLRGMGKKTQEVMAESDQEKRKGKNCWGPGGLGGDLSIALECGDDETLLTTDRSFEILAPALGKNVERVSPTSPP